MRFTAMARAAAVAAAIALVATSCADLDETASASDDGVLKVGFVTPLTGSLAVFGAPDTWVVEQMQAWFDEHPIEAGDQTFDVDIILKDSQSSATRAGEVTGELINSDGVDVVLAHATPETTVPVADQCEANATPCITADTPWQPWFYGRGGDPEKPFEWTYHFFWGLEDVAATYLDVWEQIPSNKKVAGLFPNDSDGQAWSDAFPDLIKEQGYTLDNPGLFTPGTQDFSAQIARFKKNGDEIVMGVLTPPDFATFWQQAEQQGYHPKAATIGKAVEFPAAIDALGGASENISTEVWWSPTSPYTSSVTGQTSQELADAYEEASGQQWTMPLGFSEALFEVLQAAVVEAGGADKEALADALAGLQVPTIVGDLDWGAGPVPNVAKTPLAGGQWRPGDKGGFPNSMVIVSNASAPDVPVADRARPIP